MPDLTVVTVTYNSRALIDACLDSCAAAAAQAGIAARHVVVDNASSDGTADQVAARHPGVVLIRNEVNRGFGAASNQGAAAAGSAAILFLNPDATCEPGSVGVLWRALQAGGPRVGAVGPALRYADGGFQHSAFAFPSLASLALDVWSPNWRLTESRLNGRYPRAWYAGPPFRVDFLLGACFMVSRAAWQRIGGFDEGFHLYYEEVDWFRRLHGAGLEAWCHPEASVVHLEGQSARSRPAHSWLQLQRSKLRYARKHMSRLEAHCVKASVVAAAVGRVGSARRAHARGTLDLAGLEAWQEAAREALHL